MKKLPDDKKGTQLMSSHTCKHEIDRGSIEYDSRWGRRGICKLCGARLIMWIPAKTKTGKIHMNKKERLRQRRAAEGNK